MNRLLLKFKHLCFALIFTIFSRSNCQAANTETVGHFAHAGVISNQPPTLVLNSSVPQIENITHRETYRTPRLPGLGLFMLRSSAPPLSTQNLTAQYGLTFSFHTDTYHSRIIADHPAYHIRVYSTTLQQTLGTLYAVSLETGIMSFGEPSDDLELDNLHIFNSLCEACLRENINILSLAGITFQSMACQSIEHYGLTFSLDHFDESSRHRIKIYSTLLQKELGYFVVDSETGAVLSWEVYGGIRSTRILFQILSEASRLAQINIYHLAYY